MTAELRVKCPHCKKEFAYHSSEFRPFCTEKCRLLDLGQWLDGSFSVVAQNLTQEEQDALQQLVVEDNDENQ